MTANRDTMKFITGEMDKRNALSSEQKNILVIEEKLADRYPCHSFSRSLETMKRDMKERYLTFILIRTMTLIDINY